MEKRIVLGSGKLYCSEFTGTLPTDATIEVDDNLLGLISGGATITYSSEWYTAEDDLGLAVKKMLTKEEVSLASGIMTWNGKTLAKLCSTARVTEPTTSNPYRTVKIGGIGNYDGKSYVLHFLHEDATDGDIRLTIVGTCEDGFEFSFAKDKETVLDANFKAMPSDSDGTLLIYKEDATAPTTGD